MIGSKVLLSWLISPCPVPLRNFKKSSKNDHIVKHVELLEANPHYALVLERTKRVELAFSFEVFFTPSREWQIEFKED